MIRFLTRPTARILIPLVALAIAIFVLPDPAMGASATHEITLDMRQFEFSPERIEVNQGDRVIITLSADDVVHGFYLDGYGLDTRVQPGISQRIEFVAARAGKFRFRCSVTCGPMHPFMIGEFVIGPNTLFWRVTALTLVVAAGALIHFLNSGQLSSERKSL